MSRPFRVKLLIIAFQSLAMSFLEKNKKANILEMVPHRVIENFTEKDGLVTLNLPKFKSSFMTNWIVPKNKSSHIHVNFDINGSRVWLQIDGKKSLQQICDVIRATLPEGTQIPDLEERSAKYITELYKSRFIKFMEEKL